MWLFTRALHLPRGLKSEDVMQGARRQKSQVDSGTSGGAALLGSSQLRFFWEKDEQALAVVVLRR